MIIGHINPEDVMNQDRRGRGFSAKRKENTSKYIVEKKLLALLNQLKDDFGVLFSKQSNTHSTQNSNLKSYTSFYSEYISSLKLILSSIDPKVFNVTKERDRALRDVLLRMRHSGNI